MPRSNKVYTVSLPSLRSAGSNHSAPDHHCRWKVYLNEDVLRGDLTSRTSLCSRIQRVGAKVESCYSVGVTHVVTASATNSGGDLDDTSKILRGAVLRSGFLRSGSRRSKDLLLKAAQSRREPGTPIEDDDKLLNVAVESSPGMPTVVPLQTFLAWLVRRESVLGLPVPALASNPGTYRGSVAASMAQGSAGTGFAGGAGSVRASSRKSSCDITNSSIVTANRGSGLNLNQQTHYQRHNISHDSIPEVGPHGELYPYAYPVVAVTPARNSDEVSSCISGESDNPKAAADNAAISGRKCGDDGGRSRKNKSNGRAFSGQTIKAERKKSAAPLSPDNIEPKAMMVVFDDLTQHKVMSEIFPESKKGGVSVVPILQEAAPVGMSPFELATASSVSSAIARERERSLGGSAAVTAKRRKLLAQKLKKPLSGYCENCHERYADLGVHCESLKHSQFANAKSNFEQLDSFLEMLSKARNRSQRRARSPQRRKKERGGKLSEAARAEEAAAAAAVAAEAAVAAAAKRAEEEEKEAKESAAREAAKRAKEVVDAAAAKTAAAKGISWRRSKRLRRRQVGISGGGSATPRDSLTNSICASMAANIEMPRSMPYNAEFASVLVGSLTNTPAPSTYDPDWVDEEQSSTSRGSTDSSNKGDEGDDEDGEDKDSSKEENGGIEGVASNGQNLAKAHGDEGRPQTRLRKKRKKGGPAQISGKMVPSAPAPPQAPRPPRPPSQNRRAAALLASMVESSVPGVTVKIYTESENGVSNASRSQQCTGRAKKRRIPERTPSPSFAIRNGCAQVSPESLKDNLENMQNGLATDGNRNKARLGSGRSMRKRTRSATKSFDDGCESGLAPCSLKKMKTSGNVSSVNTSKSKRLFRSKRLSMKKSR